MKKAYTRKEAFKIISERLRTDKGYLVRTIKDFNGVTIEKERIAEYLHKSNGARQEMYNFINKSIRFDTNFLLDNVYEHKEGKWYIDD